MHSGRLDALVGQRQKGAGGKSLTLFLARPLSPEDDDLSGEF